MKSSFFLAWQQDTSALDSKQLDFFYAPLQSEKKKLIGGFMYPVCSGVVALEVVLEVTELTILPSRLSYEPWCDLFVSHFP